MIDIIKICRYRKYNCRLFSGQRKEINLEISVEECHRKMRVHPRKVLLYAILIISVFLLFNLYSQNVWISNQQAPPWGQDPAQIRLPKFTDEKFHKHARAERTDNTSKPKDGALKFEPEKVDKLDKAAKVTDESAKVKKTVLWPSLEHYRNDRILTQMKHRPTSIIEKESKGEQVPSKTILLYHGLGGWNVQRGRNKFIEDKCPVTNCIVTDDRRKAAEADMIMFHHSPARPWGPRPPHQVWLLFMLESPYHTPGLNGFGEIFNWTATYRHDSVIVAPYERFTLYNESVKTLPLKKNYAAGKTKKVAWFVSNCGARNGRRQYAEELGKHIQVDIYGACGPLKCPRHTANACFDMLTKDYKFYLSFENSNCRDYITEKFFVNGLGNDVIPIVMGAAPEDYARAAPNHSFIHVDEFDTPKDLAEYLHKLDKDDDLYNEYFRYKGTGDIINTFYWCRVCSMLHEAPNYQPIIYHDLERWWRGPGVCIGQQRWRENKNRKEVIIDKY